MFDFAGPDAKRQRAEGAMGGCITVSANNGGPRQSEALLRSDDMNDALSVIPEPEICETKGFDIFFERQTL